jgi:hypothetical protein
MKVGSRALSIDWTQVGLLLTAVALAALGGYFLQPLVTKNEAAINTVVTIFSILAGFLIAVITFIVEPALNGQKDWRELQANKRNVYSQLTRHRLLFYCYLFTLALALAMFLVPDTMPTLSLWLERVFVGLSIFVLMASFRLPGSLMNLQMARYQAELDEKTPQVVKDALGRGAKE